MPELMDHVAYLSQEIGPRPAGTEEEQQAALYITEQMQKDAGLSAVIEDFNSASNDETPRAICCAVTVAITVASLFFAVLAIPAMILTALAGILYALEATGHPLISRFFARGVSQNVVAKYEPGYSADAGGARRRKVILVARYDSGKVRPELKAPVLGVLPFIQWATLVSMVLLPILLIVRNLFFLHAEGITAIVFLVLIVIFLVFSALPLIFALVHKFSSYNEAANANAAGTAVLLDVARRIGRGRVSAFELAARAEADGTVIHGEEEALASGLVPEGAKLAYEAARVQPPEPAPQTEEARLAAAKAAIAALTGKPVPQSEPVKDIADNLVQVKEAPIGQPTEEDLREQRDETREALSGAPAGEQVAPAGAPAIDGAQAGVAALAGDALAASASAALAAEAGAAEGIQQAGDVAALAAQGAATSPSNDDGSTSVPDWFKKAQENAKKSREPQPGEIHRSRYADAGAAAVAEVSARAEQEKRMVDLDTEERLKRVREGIMAEKPASSAPETETPHAPAGDLAAFGDGAATEGTPAPADEPAADPWTSGVPAVGTLPSREQALDAEALPHPFETQTDEHDVGLGSVAAMPGSTTSMPPIDVDDLRAQLAEDMGAMNAAAPKPPIVLPDIGASSTGLPPVVEMAKQRAPLAEAEQSGKTAAKSLLTMLPTIGAEEVAAEKEGKDPAEVHHTAPDAKPDLTALPSLSGAISKPADEVTEQAQGTGAVSKAGSFASMGATGTFAPVGNELIENVDPDDLYVDDADDSDYAGGVTETGAYAGPGYVEMPKSRVRRFFDRFGKKKNDEEVSAQEWLDIDGEFDARSVGAARGGWESFQETDYSESDEAYDGYDEYDEADTLGEYEEDEFGKANRPWQGGAFSRRRLVDQQAEDEYSDDAPEVQGAPLSPSVPSASGEMQQIYQFRHPDVNVEVWFVALGSELAGNAGMKAFLAEHGTELRGSVIINLNALGAGDLSLIEKEGKFRRVSASSRMKRYMKKASQATGLDSTTASITWSESASSVALRHGFQAMSIVGMNGAKPAYFAQGDDVLENIDPDTLYQNADFVMELLKNI
ncbi:aminopeptidase [Raoultibacter phocaeensis]|uniref:aminopeptidase n=1 Tax=Raoultibacter phocaeensis TaxID=2479841 RepID=UPI0015D641C7|nr:aminopeptidase [Raoultibacter phocaeensis]